MHIISTIAAKKFRDQCDHMETTLSLPIVVRDRPRFYFNDRSAPMETTHVTSWHIWPLQRSSSVLCLQQSSSFSPMISTLPIYVPFQLFVAMLSWFFSPLGPSLLQCYNHYCDLASGCDPFIFHIKMVAIKYIPECSVSLDPAPVGHFFYFVINQAVACVAGGIVGVRNKVLWRYCRRAEKSYGG